MEGELEWDDVACFMGRCGDSLAGCLRWAAPRTPRTSHQRPGGLPGAVPRPLCRVGIETLTMLDLILN